MDRWRYELSLSESVANSKFENTPKFNVNTYEQDFLSQEHLNDLDQAQYTEDTLFNAELEIILRPESGTKAS